MNDEVMSTVELIVSALSLGLYARAKLQDCFNGYLFRYGCGMSRYVESQALGGIRACPAAVGILFLLVAWFMVSYVFRTSVGWLFLSYCVVTLFAFNIVPCPGWRPFVQSQDTTTLHSTCNLPHHRSAC